MAFAKSEVRPVIRSEKSRVEASPHQGPARIRAGLIKEENVMLNVKALTITGTIVAAASYVVCAGFVAIAPDAAATIGTYIVHLDLSKVGTQDLNYSVVMFEWPISPATTSTIHLYPGH